MKISSVSKKVLCGALSAAMVVAFAPTVAMGAQTVVATNTYYNQLTGAELTVESYDFDRALAAAAMPEYNNTTTPVVNYDDEKATVTLAGDVAVTKAVTDDSTGSFSTSTGITIDLAGHTMTAEEDQTQTLAFTLIGEGTVKQAAGKSLTFESLAVGTTKQAANVTFDGGEYGTAYVPAQGVNPAVNAIGITVADGSSITIKSGKFYVTAGNKTVLQDAVDAAVAAGATVVVKNASGAAQSNTTLAENYSVEVTSTVATIEGKNYATLDAAIQEGAGKTITLTADAKGMEDATDATDGMVTIDLAGHTIERGDLEASDASSKGITLKGEGKLLGVKTSGNITIAEGANVTVDSSAAKKGETAPVKSTFSGTVAVSGALAVADDASASAAAITVNNGGSVAIAKGNYGSLTVSNGGAATVEGGTFTGAIATDGSKGAQLTVSKAVYGVTDTASVDPLNSKYIAEGSVINVLKKGASGKYEVGAPVATAQKVDLAADNKTEFKSEVKCASLQGAMVNAADKTTVVLTADVEEDIASYGSNELTIDLGGNTLKGSITASGNLTVKNGTVVAYGEDAVAVKSASGKTVVIESGTYTAEVKVSADGKTKYKPSAITALNSGTLKIAGGTFKNATYTVDVTDKGIAGGTFDKQPASGKIKDGYKATKNADGTYTVALGNVTADFAAATVDGVTTAGEVKIANKDKALEKAVEAAYSKVLTAAWTVNPAATEVAGFKFAEKNATTHELYTVKDLTDGAATNTFELGGANITDTAKYALTADKDYMFDGVCAVTVAVKNSGNVIGYLTGIAVDATYAYTQDTANYTYKFLGADATYDAEKKLYAFSTVTGEQFAVERISNSILELQEQMKQIEIAAQDKEAANSIKGTAKTIKTKKGVTGKTFTAQVKAVKSESGAVATFKKANTAGKSKITVAKSGKITIKKGLKKGTYKVKVKGTVGASSKTVYAKIVIK